MTHRSDGGGWARRGPEGGVAGSGVMAGAMEGLAGVRAPVAAAVAVLLLFGCGDDGSAPGEADAGTPVEGTVVRQDTLALTVRAVGSLKADARVVIKPEIDGHVTSVHFREGEAVEAGEVLVRLDQNKLQAEVAAARAEVARSRSEVENVARRLERNDSLLKAGAISRQTHDDVRTAHETARARLQQARANLRLTEEELEDATVRAPFAGRTGSRSFDVGDYVAVGDPLFTLVDDDPMEVRFTVPERYLGQLRLGSPVEATVRSMPGRAFEGRVDFVSPYVDSSNRTVELRAVIPNPESELRAGQFADVRLELENRAAVLVPEAAVVPRQGSNVVFAVRGGRADRREVELGARRRGLVEVVTGVEPGDTDRKSVV